MKGIINNTSKETLLSQIELNKGILLELEQVKNKHTEIFGTHLRHYKRLNRQCLAFETIINECVSEVLNILEEENI